MIWMLQKVLVTAKISEATETWGAHNPAIFGQESTACDF